MDLYPNYKTLFLFLENFSKTSEKVLSHFSRPFIKFSDFGTCFPGKNIQLNFMSTVDNLDFFPEIDILLNAIGTIKDTSVN